MSVTKEFLAITNMNWGFTTQYIRSDGEKGLGNGWKEMIAAKGITFMLSPPDTPDQNGLAERSGGGDHDYRAKTSHTEQIASQTVATHSFTRCTSFKSHSSTA